MPDISTYPEATDTVDAGLLGTQDGVTKLFPPDMVVTSESVEIGALPSAATFDGSELAVVDQAGVARQRNYTNVLADLVVVRGTGTQTGLAGSKTWTGEHLWSAGGSTGHAHITTQGGTQPVLIGARGQADTNYKVGITTFPIFGYGTIAFGDGSSATATSYIVDTPTDVILGGSVLKGFGVNGKTGSSATPMVLGGGTASGAPTTGAHVKGELVCDDAGVLYRCTVAGTPGTWVIINSTINQPLHAGLTDLIARWTPHSAFTPSILAFREISGAGSNYAALTAKTAGLSADRLIQLPDTDGTLATTAPIVTTITSSATPTFNTDNCGAVKITALAVAITSMTSGKTGTPADFQPLLIRIKDDGTARAIAWGADYEAKGTALPLTTFAGKTMSLAFRYDSVATKWGLLAAAYEA